MNILITGGASGLGEAITVKLAADKENKVFFTFNSSQDSARELEGKFSNVKGFKCDFNNESELNSLCAQIDSMDLDVLINNAISSMVKKHFHKIDIDVFRDSFASNLIPVIKITQSVLAVFRKKKFGKIINILTAALVNKPPIGWSEYIANKAYLASLSKSWAVENAAFNITSNSISPSFMKTDLTSDFDERIVEGMIESHPLKELLTPQEVADTISFFVGSSQHINGVNLVMNAASDIN